MSTRCARSPNLCALRICFAGYGSELPGIFILYGKEGFQQVVGSVDPMLALPPSDLVMTVDVRRMMDEALPRALVNAPLARAQMNAAIAKMKTQSMSSTAA